MQEVDASFKDTEYALIIKIITTVVVGNCLHAVNDWGMRVYGSVTVNLSRLVKDAPDNNTTICAPPVT